MKFYNIYRKIFKMKDDKWTTNVKLQQYRRVIGLNAREQTKSILQQSKVQFSSNLKSLLSDINKYRIDILNNNNDDDDDDDDDNDDDDVDDDGIKHMIRQKDLPSTLINLPFAEILIHVFNDVCLKQKQLDKLCYQKKQKKNKIFELKMESVIISKKINQDKKLQVNPSDKVLTRCQRSMARHNAAQSIQSTYESMLKILEKDTMYYDIVLRNLMINQKDQSKMVIKTTLMGQIAVENLDGNRQKFNKLAHQVWINILERERTLEIARLQVKHVFTFAQSLIQLKSVTDSENLNESHVRNNKQLESQIQTLKQLIIQVRKSFNEQSINVLHYRLEEQFTKKINLVHHLKRVEKEIDLLIKKQQHAQLILDAFQHDAISAVQQFKLSRLQVAKEITMLKKHKRNCKLSTKASSRLLIKSRGALQSMLYMFTIIDEKILKKFLQEKLENGIVDETEGENCMKKVDVTCALLKQVIASVDFLFNASYNLQADEMGARDLYQTYISDYYKSNVVYDKQQQQQQHVESTDILEEYEFIDSNVTTRQDVKNKSKHIVETRLANE